MWSRTQHSVLQLQGVWDRALLRGHFPLHFSCLCVLSKSLKRVCCYILSYNCHLLFFWICTAAQCREKKSPVLNQKASTLEHFCPILRFIIHHGSTHIESKMLPVYINLIKRANCTLFQVFKSRTICFTYCPFYPNRIHMIFLSLWYIDLAKAFSV